MPNIPADVINLAPGETLRSLVTDFRQLKRGALIDTSHGVMQVTEIIDSLTVECVGPSGTVWLVNLEF